ncbi:putative membrane protein YGL010W [Undibacterium sp. GrIS 1.8]|uniref:Mpo1 family 2-hydroxy fatty acid dioxygenase n=1 Tax=Undibacterium sp. GrIS 1.8 TaxID=3143934 RepID=UPI0033984CA2
MNKTNSNPASTPTTAIKSNTDARAVEQLLEKYAESHQNPTNEYIHFVCVPVIVWTVLGLLWAIHPMISIGATLLALVYYISLSVPFAIGMSLMSVLMLSILYLLPSGWVLPSALGIFVLAWVGQFIGHKIEGKKPSFFDDLRFLLIGPLFVLGFLYRRFNIAY